MAFVHAQVFFIFLLTVRRIRMLFSLNPTSFQGESSLKISARCAVLEKLGNKQTDRLAHWQTSAFIISNVSKMRNLLKQECTEFSAALKGCFSEAQLKKLNRQFSDGPRYLFFFMLWCEVKKISVYMPLAKKLVLFLICPSKLIDGFSWN